MVSDTRQVEEETGGIGAGPLDVVGEEEEEEGEG